MKKVFKSLLVLVVVLSIALFAAGCSQETGEKALGTIVEKSVDVAKFAADDFTESVDKATHDEVADLKQEGNDILSSLDEVEKSMEEGGDISEDLKKEISDGVTEVRQKVEEAMEKLDTK